LAKQFINIDDLRKRARRRLPRMLFDFIEGGAEDEHTLRSNRQGFELVRLRPRVLVDVAERSLRTTVAGETLSLPVLLAPVGLARIAGPAGELAAARGATKAGTVSVVSTAASATIEEVARVSERPQWFQLYPWGDRDSVTSMIERAKRAGYTTMVVTVDVPITGARERDLYNGMTVPPKPTLRNLADLARHPRWLASLAFGPPINFANLAGESGAGRTNVVSLARRHERLVNPGHTWEDLRWMRDLWPGKVLLKGVTCGEDAVLAVDAGCDGVVVSNHGGRQTDHVPATIQVLPEVVHAVGDRIDVLLDGGVRRGTDVVKALALGAKAVLVGRPWVYGLAADGDRGVGRALEIFAEEIDRTLALLGVADVQDLRPANVRLDRAFGLASPMWTVDGPADPLANTRLAQPMS
jgi:isopentenyl diphosphate isomerase/L-lactate dehydrogenase-like FMN-dependent dehydrogenase